MKLARRVVPPDLQEAVARGDLDQRADVAPGADRDAQERHLHLEDRIDHLVDPAQYGMEAQYDDKGEYIYPEGFDPETQEWLEGYDSQREEWEKRYAKARERFEAHKKQLEDAQKADADAASGAGEATSYSSDASGGDAAEAESGGSLASDEALAALREKLAGR